MGRGHRPCPLTMPGPGPARRPHHKAPQARPGPGKVGREPWSSALGLVRANPWPAPGSGVPPLSPSHFLSSWPKAALTQEITACSSDVLELVWGVLWCRCYHLWGLWVGCPAGPQDCSPPTHLPGVPSAQRPQLVWSLLVVGVPGHCRCLWWEPSAPGDPLGQVTRASAGER